MIPLKLIFFLVVLILIFLLFLRKKKGLSGTWDSKREIEEYAIIMSDFTKDQKVQQIQKPSYESPDTNPIPKESIGEKICRNFLENTFKKPFPKCRPDWLKNPVTANNLELDCFSSELNLAVEYNGRQHYEFVPKFHKTKNDLYNQKYRDDIKKRLCYKNGVDLIIVSYKIPHENIPYYLQAALEKLNRLKVV